MALTQIFYDTFTDTTGTDILVHTPDTGVGWSAIVGNADPDNTQIGSDGTLVQPFHNGTQRNYFAINAAQPATANQQVSAVYNGATVRLCLRLNNGSSSANCVLVEFSNSLNRTDIIVVSEGVRTALTNRSAFGAIVVGAVCRAQIDESNNVYAWIDDVPVDWSQDLGQFDYNVASAPISGAVGWCGVKSYSTGGADNFTAWYDTGGGGASNITISETLPALSSSMSMTFTSAAGTSNVSISDTLPALDSSLSMTFTAAGVGTITIPDWANNTGTALPSITDITVNVRSLVDGSTVYRTTTASTDVNADCVVSDAAIVSGTQYEVTALKFNGVDYDIGIAIITAT